MQIAITDECKKKMTWLARRARALRNGAEIGGFGKVRRLSQSSLLIFDCWPVKHEGYSGGHSDLDVEAIGREITKLHAAGDVTEEESNRNADEMRMWWHAHPQGGPSDFSGTDIATIEKDLKNFRPDWMLGVLTNGEWVKAALMIWEPFIIRLSTFEVEYLKPAEAVVGESRVALAKKALDDAIKAEEEEVKTSIDALVEDALPPKKPFAGHYPHSTGWLHGQSLIPYSRPFYDSNSKAKTVKDLVWPNTCSVGRCMKKPRFMSPFSLIYCRRCVSKHPTGTSIKWDCQEPNGIPTIETARKMDFERFEWEKNAEALALAQSVTVIPPKEVLVGEELDERDAEFRRLNGAGSKLLPPPHVD